MPYIHSRLFPSEIASVVGNYAFRKLQKKISVPMDVFFNFKNVGDYEVNSYYSNEVILANQGEDTAISLETMTGNTYGVTSIKTGVGLSCGHTNNITNTLFRSAGFKICGVDADFAAGPKTICFRMTSATVSKKWSFMFGPNDETYGRISLTAEAEYGKNYMIGFGYQGDDTKVPRAIDPALWSTTDDVFAMFGAKESIINKNIFLTVGSESEPDLMKVYADGVLVAVFDRAGQELGYCDLASSDNAVRCFYSTITGKNSQDWGAYTLSMFGMTRGVLNANEIKRLNSQLNAYV